MKGWWGVRVWVCRGVEVCGCGGSYEEERSGVLEHPYPGTAMRRWGHLRLLFFNLN